MHVFYSYKEMENVSKEQSWMKNRLSLKPDCISIELKDDSLN